MKRCYRPIVLSPYHPIALSPDLSSVALGVFIPNTGKRGGFLNPRLNCPLKTDYVFCKFIDIFKLLKTKEELQGYEDLYTKSKYLTNTRKMPLLKDHKGFLQCRKDCLEILKERRKPDSKELQKIEKSCEDPMLPVKKLSQKLDFIFLCVYIFLLRMNVLY